jgi:hypothetical protein
MLPSLGHDGHSAEIDMRLLVNGVSLSIGQMGPDFLLLDESMDHPPAEATIVFRLDANERRWRVKLPDGLSAKLERVVVEKL